jgi:acyl-CoA reductase-like NAD-dependent aldehyde dehydrogenase
MILAALPCAARKRCLLQRFLNPEIPMSVIKARYPYYLANKPVDVARSLPVTDKYSGAVVTQVALADAAAIDRGIAAAVKAAPAMAALAAYERQEILNHCVMRFRERFDELAETLCVEAGKPIRDARGEVTRLIDTFRIAAEEAVRMHGALQTLDISPRLSRHVEASADRTVFVYLAVQFSVESGCPQGGTGTRGGLPLCDEAGLQNAARRTDHW